MVSLIAIGLRKYNGIALVAGQAFEVRDQDARVLILMGKARLAGESIVDEMHSYKDRRLLAVIESAGHFRSEPLGTMGCPAGAPGEPGPDGSNELQPIKRKRGRPRKTPVLA